MCLKPGAGSVRRRKAYHLQILPPAKLLGMHFARGITLVSPGILAMMWFILEPELLGAPLSYIPLGVL